LASFRGADATAPPRPAYHTNARRTLSTSLSDTSFPAPPAPSRCQAALRSAFRGVLAPGESGGDHGYPHPVPPSRRAPDNPRSSSKRPLHSQGVLAPLEQRRVTWVVHRVNIVCDVVVKSESRPHPSNNQIACRIFEVRDATPEFTKLRLAERRNVVRHGPASLESPEPCDRGPASPGAQYAAGKIELFSIAASNGPTVTCLVFRSKGGALPDGLSFSGRPQTGPLKAVIGDLTF